VTCRVREERRGGAARVSRASEGGVWRRVGGVLCRVVWGGVGGGGGGGGGGGVVGGGGGGGGGSECAPPHAQAGAVFRRSAPGALFLALAPGFRCNEQFGIAIRDFHAVLEHGLPLDGCPLVVGVRAEHYTLKAAPGLCRRF